MKVPILLKPAKDAGSNKDLEKDLAENARLFHTSNSADGGERLRSAGNADGTGLPMEISRSVAWITTHRFC